MERDELLRAQWFSALTKLRTHLGDDLPLVGALDQGFMFDGGRVPFLNRYKGIHRAARQRGPAALSIMTSYTSPYDDGETETGLGYAYRAGDSGEADNRALREAHASGVPIVYFVATRPGWFRAEYPCYVAADDPVGRRVTIVRGVMTAVGEPELPGEEIARRYLVREVRQRLHQGRFRGVVLTAYRDRCTICRLQEPRLLDASHIVADADPAGVPEVTNGLSLCSIHHRAFDHNLVGISPDYDVHVAPRLLDEDDGPMLDLLKGFHGSHIAVPQQVRSRPDRELLARRYEEFTAA